MTGWSYSELESMDMKELHYWVKEAVDLHKQLNTPSER